MFTHSGAPTRDTETPEARARGAATARLPTPTPLSLTQARHASTRAAAAGPRLLLSLDTSLQSSTDDTVEESGALPTVSVAV